ncbi:MULTISPECIES: YihY/virulence factor BrkB family protein [Streptomyces]|uniref:Ribonuclease BN n=1 Tax=Streptomyces venezuelae (strain ATCC 10712 / CBS 650.69 / DSM 40230 / JCM 4526 / NBRC 13096 / PD 04745) TaxID=953739 RepID=F2R8L4_STRVP|nr:YihY/virulence factor BrkB family protein [Streptomyces venezuelae]APE20086.1 ribonuclease BN [Streptomyces venezuelae]QER97488.1 YihY/virulence factor BrkB family protein [Streptomyces venezuelae ATCC 10712]CCA53932.1 Ribonuclease BN [Streptomyces venezuelae ATCC 10712]
MTPNTRHPRQGAPGHRGVELLGRARSDLRLTAVRLWDDNIADCAAALTYYAVLALVPALLVSVSLVGLAGADAREHLIRDLTSYLPPQSAQVLREALEGLTSAPSSLWALLVSGVLSALWSASSYLAVFRRALHTMHRLPDTRPPLRAAHVLVLTAGALLALLVAGAASLVASGPVARQLAAGAGHSGTAAMAVLRWPVLLVIVTALILLLYRTGPVQARGARRGFPGGALAALLWLGASALFTVYTQFGTYSRLYGSLAGVVVFLVWLWFSNLALLTGAQFNAVRARTEERTEERTGGRTVERTVERAREAPADVEAPSPHR